MTYLDVARFFKPTIDEKAANYILWNETAFPFSGVRETVTQLRAAIRRMRLPHRPYCDTCGQVLWCRGCETGLKRSK